MKKLLALLGSFALCLTAQCEVKVLDWSWNNPTIDFLETHLEQMKREAPLPDGLFIRVTGSEITGADGKKWTPGVGNAWNRRAWKRESFNDFITRFRKLDMGHFTDNFLVLTTTGADFDWTSDADFAAVANNFKVAAEVAKACGMKGLGVDIEEYGKHFWHAADSKSGKTPEELAGIVFRRGQEWGKAVFGSFPGIKLFMPFALSATDMPLSLDFINGVLDVMPPTATIYEGMESSTYAACQSSAYLAMQNDLRLIIRREVRPENRAKAFGQIRFAPGFYLDAYFTMPASSYYRKNLEPYCSELGAVKLLSKCFAAATLEADPYVWLYGEKRCWWTQSPHPQNQGLWDEAPEGKGLTEALLAVKNPVADFGSEKNIIPNHDFRETGNWSLWKSPADEKSAAGKGEIGDGKCVLSKFNNACFFQNIACKPGETYLLAVRGIVAGGSGTASLAFKDGADKWLPASGRIILNIPPTGKLETVSTFVTVPLNAKSVSVQCGAAGQGETGEVRFSDIYLEER